jgi:hypothetical protein
LPEKPKLTSGELERRQQTIINPLYGMGMYEEFPSGCFFLPPVPQSGLSFGGGAEVEPMDDKDFKGFGDGDTGGGGASDSWDAGSSPDSSSSDTSSW